MSPVPARSGRGVLEPGGPPPGRAESFVLALLLACALLLRLGDFGRPWGCKGWQQMGAFNALAARNWVEQGWLDLRLAPTLDPLPPASGTWDVVLHRPPGAPLLVSAAFAAFGVGEASAQGLAIAASLVQWLATWAIARRCFGARAGLATAVLGACVPAAAFYGSLVDDMGPLLSGPIALACWMHLRWLDRPSARTLAARTAALALACSVNWQGLEIAALAGLHDLGLRRRLGSCAALGLVVAVPALCLAQRAWVDGAVGPASGYGTMWDALWWRTWGGLHELGGPAEALGRLALQVAGLHGWATCALALAGLAGWRRSDRSLVAFVLAGFALLDMLVFLEGATRHDYWATLATPGLLVLAGCGTAVLAEALARRLPRLPVAVALVLLVAWPAVHGASTSARLFARIDDGFPAGLGRVIRKNTPARSLVLTCEEDSTPRRAGTRAGASLAASMTACWARGRARRRRRQGSGSPCRWRPWPRTGTSGCSAS